jgi:anti-anti-sigma regulatory factor
MEQTTDTFAIHIDENNSICIKEQSIPTVESSEEMVLELHKFIEKHGSKTALIDLSSVSTLPSSAVRKNISNMLKTSGLQKIAIFGPSLPVRIVARFIIGATGLHNIKFFQTEENAHEWLNQQ